MEENPFLKILKRSVISVITPESLLQHRLQALFSLGGDDLANMVISVEPGSYTRVGNEELPGVALSLPIAYDIWYLFHTTNLIPSRSEAEEKQTKETLDYILKPFFEQLHGVKPLKVLRSYDDLKQKRERNFHKLREYLINAAPYMIKEMRFETTFLNKSFEYPSPGPSWRHEPSMNQDEGGLGDLYAAYIAFPVGPLGVMEVLSLVGDAMLIVDPETENENIAIDIDVEYIPVQPVDDTEEPVEGLEMFPPQPIAQNACMGMHIFESAYIAILDEVEYPATDFKDQVTVAPHNWLRYWIKKEAKWPMPGEFVALLCRPNTAPPHVWWFQEICPFLYSGNWFETEYLTSGQIIAILEKESPESDQYVVIDISTYFKQIPENQYCPVLEPGQKYKVEGTTKLYKVQVKGEQLFLWASDFCEYAIDDRVAVLKTDRISYEKPESENENFDWSQLEEKTLRPQRNEDGEVTFEAQQVFNEKMADRDPIVLCNEWVIAPITFYIGT